MEETEKKPEIKGESKLTSELNNVSAANPNPKVLDKGEKKPPEATTEDKKPDGRGRPPKDKTKEGEIKNLEERLKKLKEDEKSKGEKIFLTPMMNATLIPLAAKKYKKKKEDLCFNEAEVNLLNGLQPPIYSEQASWPAYVITAVSLLIVHFYTSETERVEKEIDTLKQKFEEFKNEGATATNTKSRVSDNVSGATGERQNTDNKKTGKK